MNHKSQNIVDPESIQSVKDFEWIAKAMANGFLHGKHFSTRLGTGNEFQQFRPYVEGDDIRGIDWKMYAKTDKFYIKQTKVDTEHKFLFLLDDSKSMNYKENGWTKSLLSKLLIATMMRIVANQGDEFGWQCGGAKTRVSSGLRHWQYCIEHLYKHDQSGSRDIMTPSIYRNASIVWISDFYHPISEVETQLRQVKNPSTEVLLFHILGEAEQNLDFGRNTTFVDLESGERLDINAPLIRKKYVEKLGNHIRQLKNIGFNFSAGYHEVSMNQSILQTLRHFYHGYQFQSV